MTTLIIDDLVNDLQVIGGHATHRRRGAAEGDPEKHLELAVPFDHTFENLKAETEKAVRALAEELETATN